MGENSKPSKEMGNLVGSEETPLDNDNSNNIGAATVASSKNDDNTASRSTRKKKKRTNETSDPTSTSTKATKNVTAATLSLEDQLAYANEMVQQEKAGKRKLFHSLVKLAHELRRTRDDTLPLREQRAYDDRTWYEGGLWRAPTLLPGAVYNNRLLAENRASLGLRDQVLSLTELFFSLTIVTAFTRVGVAISSQGFVDVNSLLYFAVFWTVWSKETSYSTRFDTTDLSARAVTLVTCFAVLFASLSVQQPMNSVDGGRIMAMAGFVAGLHLLLYIRVAVTIQGDDDYNDEDQRSGAYDEDTKQSLQNATRAMRANVMMYAIVNIIMNFLEMSVWFVGVLVFSVDWPYRWLLFFAGILLSLRVPRAFLPNDFHAACSKRGVLFILLLGFMMQSIIVVASEFFTYQTPTLEHYVFIGSACTMLFCIKLLYVDDADTPAEDHAYMVNRTSAFFFNLGNFVLLLSSTILGSGLNLLTHDYLAATQALPGPSKSMVCAGFAAVLFSTLFIKSMHVKRIPDDGRGHCLFITAYSLQAMTLLAVVGVSATMAFMNVSGLLAVIMERDIVLLAALSGSALVLVIMHMLDEGVALALYGGMASSSYRVHPFGFWWCLKPSARSDLVDERRDSSTSLLFVDPTSPMFESTGLPNERMSFMKPLLGSSSSLLNYRATVTAETGSLNVASGGGG